MCGLVGLISKYRNGFTQVQKDVFTSLLFIDILRGDDSTGAFLIRNNGDLKMIKSGTHAIDFMRHQEYKTLLNQAFSSGSALVGHNRKATRGVVNDGNAHPFLVDDRICLVHNGTLWGDHKTHADVEVDSHAIAHLLAKHSVEEVANKIDGAYALIWHDFENNTLNFLRNSQRPLFWVETANEWLWSSEDTMLEFVESRHNLTFLSRPKMQPEHTHTVFTLVNGAWAVDSTEITIKPKTYTSYQAQANAYSWAFGDYSEEVPDVPRKDTTPAVEDKEIRSITYGFGTTAVTKIEKETLEKHANLVTADDFEFITKQYPVGGQVTCIPFDALLASDEDPTAGIHIYFTPIDDTDVIIRQKFAISDMSEEKAYQIALSNQQYRLTLSTRSWHKVDGIMTKDKKGLGIVLFNSSKIVSVTPAESKENRVVH